MAETIQVSLSKLTDADLHAIVAYLKSTPAKTTYANKQDAAFTEQDSVGRRAYLNDCASCHQLDGKGIPGAVASLVGDALVLAGGPQDVIRVVLGGIEAKGEASPMPAIGVGMTDQDIADAVNYVRQSWGNTAPGTAGGGMVGDIRKSTATVLNLGAPARSSTSRRSPRRWPTRRWALRTPCVGSRWRTCCNRSTRSWSS